MTVEAVDGNVVACAWFDADGELRRGQYVASWLVPADEVLA